MTSNIVEQYGRKIYNLRFYNLADLYYYLKDNPEVNTKSFPVQSSLKRDWDFYGEPLSTSIEYLLGGYREDFDNFIETNNELKTLGTQVVDSRTLKRSIYGGIPLASLVAAEIPACRLTYERSQPVRYVTIHFDLGYPAQTRENQIINRGLATLYIIRALEQKGYIVDFKAFSLSRINNEYVKIIVDLKRPGDVMMDMEKVYFPIKAKEFFRRIIFRVMESVPFSYDWRNYGYGCNKDLTRELLEVKQDDLIIFPPGEMSVLGSNIYQDTIRIIEILEIEDEFEMDRLVKLSKKNGN